jgi:hypothetical protein
VFLRGRGKIQGGAEKYFTQLKTLSKNTLYKNLQILFLRGGERIRGGAKNKIRSVECGMRSFRTAWIKCQNGTFVKSGIYWRFDGKAVLKHRKRYRVCHASETLRLEQLRQGVNLTPNCAT